MKIDTAQIESDIKHADKMREIHLGRAKHWRQEVYRLRTDLERAKRINASHEA